VKSGTRLRLRLRTRGKRGVSSIDHCLELLRGPAARRRAGAVTHRAGPPAKSKSRRSLSRNWNRGGDANHNQPARPES